MNQAPIVVVGGGLAGLSAAARVALANRPVIVLERARDLGGRGRTTQENGFSMNFGPHALAARGDALPLLAEVGVNVKGGMTPSGGMMVSVDRELTRLPTGIASLLSTSLLPFADKFAFGRAIMDLAGLPLEGPPVSLTEWLASRKLCRRSEAVIHAVARLSSYANAPDSVDARAIAAQLRKSGHGVLYVHQGWGSIVRALAGVVTSHGGTIRSDATVSSVSLNATNPQITLATGEAIDASAVILAVPPRVASKITNGHVHHELTAVRAACLDVALTGVDPNRPWFVLGIDQPTYLSVHTVCASLAPDHGALIHVAKYLPEGEEPNREDETLLEGELDLAHPGWRTRVVSRRFLPNIVVSHALPAAGKRRPCVAVPDSPRVFLAGDWVGDTGMLADAVLSSAKVAAMSALSLDERGATRQKASG